MNSADIQVIVSICAMLITIGTAVWNLITAGSRKNEKQIQQLIELNAEQTKRIDTLESTVKTLPDVTALHNIQLSLAELRGDMRVISTSMEPLKGLATHINELLIENAKGKP
ncbi:DUF2730 family protein [Bartonella sp. HY761]|uniref:DUF2730 family protein n=1 Tax=Bartonella sp. HY761 TaxID=2979330 RepID=UPI0021FACC4C|nr:DUF2730 family protein [Bartonella sp. HY761]UXN07529.1 DUF2730 domain-containing protein [Bartonella sp. HY761]